MNGDDACRAQAPFAPMAASDLSEKRSCFSDVELPEAVCCDTVASNQCSQIQTQPGHEPLPVIDGFEMFPKPASGTCEKPPVSQPPTILDEAARITAIDRNATYGPPRDNHSRTAELWSAYLGITLNYRDVCWLNVLQKASRDRHKAGDDNLIDSCGYLRNIEMAENDEGRT